MTLGTLTEPPVEALAKKGIPLARVKEKRRKRHGGGLVRRTELALKQFNRIMQRALHGHATLVLVVRGMHDERPA